MGVSPIEDSGTYSISCIGAGCIDSSDKACEIRTSFLLACMRLFTLSIQLVHTTLEVQCVAQFELVRKSVGMKMQFMFK